MVSEADPGELILSDVPVFEELLNGGESQKGGQKFPPPLHSFLPPGMLSPPPAPPSLVLFIWFSGIRMHPWVGLKGHA